MAPTVRNVLPADDDDGVGLREGAVMAPDPIGLTDGDDSVALGWVMPPTPVVDLEPPVRDVFGENCASARITDENRNTAAKPMIVLQ